MDGKKKKNKKKKGNSQSKLADAVVEEVADSGSAAQLNHIPRVPSTTDVQSVGVSESDIELDMHKFNEERFVKLQEEVRQLEDERNHWLQKEAILDGKIKLLHSDVDSCIKHEASLEEKLKSLQNGNDILIQKQDILEDRVKHMEGIKDSWISKEVKEVHIESHQHAKTVDHPSPPKLDEVKKPAESAVSVEDAPVYTEGMYESGDMVPSFVGDHGQFGVPNGVEGSLNGVGQGHQLGMDNPRISEDVVSVPLDDIYVQEIEPQAEEEDETPLPISDAPLIGAPFRLISFFAKYVSGADLVHQDGGRPG